MFILTNLANLAAKNTHQNSGLRRKNMMAFCLFISFLSSCGGTGNQQPEQVTSEHASSSKWQPYDGMQVNASLDNYLAIPFMPVTEYATADSIKIADKSSAVTIYYSELDAKVVEVAAQALAQDIKMVTGAKVSTSTQKPSGDTIVIVGTVGDSPLIDKLIKNRKIDVSEINGKWEAYTAQVVKKPLEGVAQALVIAGSDRRGTAYGVFALSEAIGISPWHFWGDVPAPNKQALYVSGQHIQPSPAVKYRGIFINDEDWGLLPWASKTFEPETGNIGPKTYATVYELLLRLHANMIWPGMHEFPRETTPFYLMPGNKEMADKYAIVISTSHHEPMLTNSHEFKDEVHGEYNYWTNRDTIFNFWEERVKETAEYENIYTIGMRGRTDVGMLAPEGTTDEGKAKKIQNDIIPDQRKMIAEHVHHNPTEIPQIFIPYKETLVQYQSGLELPDDVIMVWPDDNHGYIRQLSTPEEQKRTGGSGVYYHLSYWGVPASYLWLNSTPPGMTYAEMIKAWDFNANKIWIVNVGDIKPHEFGTEFFLRMARNPEAFRNFDQHKYFTQWAQRTFGQQYAQDIANVMHNYFSLNIVKRPEHMHTSGDNTFSMIAKGDEAAQRLNKFAQTAKIANMVYQNLDKNLQSAFYQMVLYPLRASHLINQKELYAERSRLWAKQQRAATDELAAKSTQAHQALMAETQFYNKVNAQGKWQNMLSPMPLTDLPTWGYETQNPWRMPKLGNYQAPDKMQLAVALEGQAEPIGINEKGKLPLFNRAANTQYFIDVFNQGKQSSRWFVKASHPWVDVSQTRGNQDARITVGIDWQSAPIGTNVPASLRISDGKSTYAIELAIFNPADLPLGKLPKAVENKGVVEIEAEHYFAKANGKNGSHWQQLDNAAASQHAMTVHPITTKSVNVSRLQAQSPSLSYQFYAASTGRVKIQTQALPTHKITSQHPGVRYAISLNGEAPQIIDLYAKEYSKKWNVNTLRAAAFGISNHKIDQPGVQEIKIWMVDAGVVLDKFTVEIEDE
ncbi:glycosyl hydrolase 115 family protein [Catenovulum adriaticum]|uniref:Glycosyl hydrolase 115 family protein n=1 Tax=Catenovulum adriaticum TaxID=2984846 RepID=A0ABY7ATB9_9ALTE|nr:glycosyl hydrolase 115 family protein [Catenovulum sp. TS8]WAJ71911.1 glycosyl hydrolase 115 family protein [Catenovulum sp. TS8]